MNYNLDECISHFKSILEKQLARCEKMKNDTEKTDFSKKDKIIIGVIDGDGIGPIIVSEAERIALLIPTESLFSTLSEVKLSEFYERLSRSGCEIYQKKIGTHHAVGERVRLSGKGGFFALGEVREYEGGSAIKAIKQFDV